VDEGRETCFDKSDGEEIDTGRFSRSDSLPFLLKTKPEQHKGPPKLPETRHGLSCQGDTRDMCVGEALGE
jgi:hypothetical protein